MEFALHKILRAAAVYPDKVAIRDQAGELTYAQLETLARRIAAALISRGIEKGDMVAIELPRVKEYTAAMLGCWLSGAGFAPLDSGYPEARLRFVEADCRAKAVIDEALLAEAYDMAPLEAPVTPDEGDIAIVVYTSGSTGNPKGVVHTQLSIASAVKRTSNMIDITPDDVFAMSSVFTFIVHVLEILTPLSTGVTIIMEPDDVRRDSHKLSDFLFENNISMCFISPQILRNFKSRGGALRRVICGSERVVDGWSPMFETLCSYGLSETAAAIFSFTIDKNYSNTPIGKPIGEINAYLLDDQGNECDEGEICVSGNIASGYLNLPEKTAEVFVPNPFAEKDGCPVLFHTGDLGKRLPDGNILYLNRKDWMVKINGQRVEPGEIETQLRMLPGIENAAVKGFENEYGQTYLCAFYTETEPLDQGWIRGKLSEKLASYMIPAFFVRLDKMPVNANGKMDRKALLAPDASMFQAEYAAPETDAQRILCEGFAKVLKLEKCGIDDDFFALGGDSIKTVLLAEHCGALGLSSLDVLSGKTPRNIAALIGERENDELPDEYDADHAPLTDSQLGVYLECVQDPESCMYNIPTCWRFSRHQIDAEKLRAALARVMVTYSAFSVRTGEIDGVPSMMRSDKLPEITMIAAGEDEMAAIREAFVRPFDLKGGELCHAQIVSTESSVYLMLDMHHIVSDGTSVGVIQRAIAAAYSDIAPEAEQLDPFMLSAIENSDASMKASDADLDWFRNRLGGLEVDSSLPVDMPDNTDKGAGGRVSVDIALEPGRVENFVRSIGVTENTLFLAAYAYALEKFSGGAGESMFCTVNSGRHSPRTKNTVGMLVRTLPVYAKIDEAQRVSEFLQGMQADFFETMRHDNASFGDIAREMGFNSDMMFVYQAESLGGFAIDGAEAALETLDTGYAQAKVSSMVFRRRDSYEISLEYRSALYEEDSIRRLGECFGMIVEGMMKCATLGDIQFTPESDLALLSTFDGEITSIDPETSMTALLRAQAKRTPDNIALVYAGQQLTYREYDALSDRLAAYMHLSGIGKGNVVSILLPRCILMPVVAAAVLKTGAAYQPLDPSYPPERLNFMVQDADAKLLVADRELVELVNEYTGPVLYSDQLDTLEDAPSPEVNVTGSDAMILLYTSGTTGTPKGCVLEHGNIINYCSWYAKKCALNASSKVAAYASFGFDANMMDTYPTLMSGAALHILPEEIRLDIDAMGAYFNENGITNAFMTTQVGRQFAISAKCPELRTLSVGGEKLAPVMPPEGIEFINLYGPTECSVAVTGYTVLSDSQRLPIGKPTDNTRLYVMDKLNRIMPIGVPGELCISGAQVARGYLNRPEQTEKVFIRNPHSDEPLYSRMYRTGDVVRWLPDGNIEFIGRRDGQVKVRGFRIELTEVENVIRSFPGIKNVTVVAKDAAAGGKMLAAYIVSDETVDIKALNSFILSEKPPYMVPAVTMQIDAIPLNVNGKVDKRKLPEPKYTQDEGNANRAETQLEKEIGDAVEAVLGHRDFNVETEFVIAGLSSISAIKLASEFSNRFGYSPNVKELLNGGCVLSVENALVANWRSAVSAAPEVKTVARDAYPLTQTQLGIYLECMMDAESDMYNIPMALKLAPSIDDDKLEQAVRAAVEAHPFIKCRVESASDGSAVMKPRDDYKWSIPRCVCAEADMAVRLSAAPDVITLDSDALFAFEIVRTEAALYLMMNFHHIVMDGSSVNVLIADIERAYNGEKPETEKYTSFDLAMDEEAARKGEAYKKAKAYYDASFEGVSVNSLPAPDVTDLPEGNAKFRFAMPGVAHEAVETFCAAHNVTPNALFTAGFGYLLGRMGGQEEAVFASIYNGRTDARTFGMLGMLVKTYPICMRLDSERKVADFVGDVRDSISGLTANDLYSYAEASRAYGVDSDIIFAYQGDEFVADSFAGESAELIAIELTGAKSPLNVDVLREGDKYIMSVEYRRDMYAADSIRWMADAYGAIVSGMLTADTLADIDPCSAEAHAYLESVNDTSWPVEFRPACTLMEQTAAKYPERTAIVTADEKLSYAQLNAAANRLAHGLIDLGVKPGDIVALMLPRSANVYVTRQGILKTGGAFLTIDPKYPDDRIAYMLEDSGAKAIVVDSETYAERSAFLDSLDCRAVTSDALLACENHENPGIVRGPEDLCYCIYTSGSTGKPKGVMLSQMNLVNFVDANPRNHEILGYTEHAKVSLAQAAFTFDVSIMEEFIPLANGMTICMAGEEEIHNPAALAKLMNENSVDMMSCTPSFLANMIDMKVMTEPLSRVQSYDFGAEAFPPSLMGKILAVNPNAYIMNGYGPTEATISCTMDVVTDARRITIGRPNANVKAYIIDEKLHILPPRMCGELVICGDGVGIGYVGRDDLTKEKFIDLNGMRAYRTGDLAEYTHDGLLLFHGRTDNQVKLRGLRVELGEIESAINSYPGVLTSLVQVRGKDTNQFLAAWFTASREIDTGDLQAEIGKTLTHYMVPSVFMQLDAMPLTANGKIDKTKLPEPEYKQPDRPYAAPANAVEEDLCKLFAEILQLDRVGAEDDFFELGGTSLTASRIAMFAMDKGYNIVYADIFKNPTPRGLAGLVLGEEADVPVNGADVTDFDYASLENTLSFNVRENLDKISLSLPDNILLTGATGFLGVHMLWRFLKECPGTAYCLLRKGNAPSVEDRLRSMLEYYFTSGYEEYFENGRIVCIEGDITDRESLKQLDDLDFAALINCAALVKHFDAGDQLEKINVEGVKNLIDCCMGRERRLIQVSTVSIAGESVNGAPAADKLLYENELFFGQLLENDYIRSKFRAERLVLEAISKGLDAKIMRVGNLMGRYVDGRFQINFMSSGFMRQLRGYKLLKAFPMSMMYNPVEFSEIGATAESILRLSGTDSRFTVFHPCNNHLITMADVIYNMQVIGLEIDVVSDDAFQQKLSAALADPAMSDAVGGLIAYMNSDSNVQRSMLDASYRFTTEALFRLGIKWPITSPEYLRHMMGTLKELGMFDQ